MGYVYRLACLCLASFFVVHLLSGLVVKFLGRLAVHVAGRMPARSAARFLFALRLLPVTFSGFIVAGLCVPSYLWLEPRGIVEPVGPACLAAALIAVIISALSVSRSLYAIRCSQRYARGVAPGSLSPAVALVGLFRPKLIISGEALAMLSPQELDSATRHEQAHRRSHDNLKRLLILLMPGLLPFWNPLSAIERAWARFAEWAADDYAAAEDVEYSLTLAAALVRVARLGRPSQAAPLITAFLADGSDLSIRVERLLRPDRYPVDRMCVAIPAVALVSFGLGLALAVHATSLESIHQLLEHLIH